MKNKEIMDSLIKEIDETKQKPFSREKVVILSRNEKNAIDNKILCLQEENAKLKKVIDLIVNKCVNTIHIIISKDVKEYNKWASKYYQLTQKEYNLLKEFANER